MSELRPDLAAIAAMIRSGARVLDVGCGDGALLEHLKTRDVDGRGIEISQANVNACVARGLAVDPQRVWMHYQEMNPRHVWWQGKWSG